MEVCKPTIAAAASVDVMLPEAVVETPVVVVKRARRMFWDAGLSVSVINNHFLQMKNMGWSHD